ncbi:YopX family protein [Leptotrichia shahii]|uniref:YopX family protein n=1 Tax=Leptotrichia shahii TaxID=157691 RepID=UPI0028D2A431|nr:YopX family protein [Leptotrichia shahii]
MREIKFRAWLKEDKKMVNVETMDFTDKSIQYLKKSEIINAYILRRESDDDVELMQYTGLKDKNGKEIYEGDILFFRDENMKYIVVWQDAAFIIKSIEIRKYSEKMCWLDDTEICCEIVGNIYENKKLLEENE